MVHCFHHIVEKFETFFISFKNQNFLGCEVFVIEVVIKKLSPGKLWFERKYFVSPKIGQWKSLRFKYGTVLYQFLDPESSARVYGEGIIAVWRQHLQT